ncbi:MAG: LCP family protein, partial [Anaerolineae bacterium]|nr:LCP family protein [Anaerolineae bacterium]
SPVPTPTPRPWVDTDNYLILGTDRRPAWTTWRTDTIMIAGIDWDRRRVGIVSIPRDLYVDIPGIGQTRINRADYIGESTHYPGGGPALLRRVLTQTIGIDAPHYVRINIYGFQRLVDALGGVTVTLDCPLYEATPDKHSPTGLAEWTLPAGTVWLNGEDARRFATYRYYSSDLDRARRQQQLLWALRDRALQLDLLPRLPELWRAFQGMVQTNLTLPEILRLAQLGAQLKPEDVHGLAFDFTLVEQIVTERGEDVLRVRDPGRLHAWLNSIFDARPLRDATRHDGKCPPPPHPITPTPTITPTRVTEVGR